MLKLCQFLVDNGAPIGSFHLMVYSAGAHILIHLKIRSWQSWNLNFERQCLTAIEFVEIIHTDGGRLFDDNVVFDEPWKHNDICYVNGGENSRNVLVLNCVKISSDIPYYIYIPTF